MTQTTPPTWSRVKAILADALELESAKREAFLDEACAGQPALRRRVSGLIGAYTATGALADVDSPARNLPLQPAPGAVLGRYRVTRLIGRGGMGAVYEAVDEQLGRPVAVKLLQSGMASRNVMKRFELEPKLLARLRHPAIAQIFETGTVSIDGESVPFFSMELVPDAMPITAFAESRGLSVPDRLRLFLRVCDAVTHGHQRRVIHRDLKPANILVDSAGNPKVIDFGVGRASDAGGAATTAAGELLGTIRYMSPEQVTGDPDEVDVRADVYALGVVLYELLSGHAPHPESKGGVLESIRAAEFRTPLPLSRLAPTLGGDIQTIALKAVAPLASARYQSVAELSGDITRFLSHEPISARPQSAIYHLRLFARRHRALVVGAAAIFTALALGIIGTSIGLYRARRAEHAAVAQTRRAERVAAFLKNTIRSADPGLLSAKARASLDPAVHVEETWFAPPSSWDSAGPAEVGVTGLLRHAASHLQTEFADDPLLQAEMAVLLAHTLATLEDQQRAIVLAEQALALQIRLLPSDDEAIIRTRVLLGRMQSLASQHVEAEAQFKAAVAPAQRRFGPLDRRTLAIGAHDAFNMIGMPGRFEEGVGLMRTFVRDVSEARGADSADAWLQHMALIEMLRWSPGPDRAEIIAECRAAIEGLSRTVGPDSAPVARACWCLAGELMDRRETLAEAESLQRRALKIGEGLYGTDGRECYEARSALLNILMRQERVAEAEPLAHEALESSLRMIGPASPYTHKAKGRLARILVWLEKDADRAERLAREAAESGVIVAGPVEDFACYHDAIWAGALRLRGDPARAEAKLRDRINLRGPRTPQTPGAWVEAYEYLQLALCLADQHRPDEARDAVRTAAVWAEQLGDPLHPIRLNILQVRPKLDPQKP